MTAKDDPAPISGSIQRENEKITVQLHGFPSAGLDPPGDQGPRPPDISQLLLLYSETGSHDRHFSTIRMTATSLLFTIAIALATALMKTPDDPRWFQGVIPASMFLLSLTVNYYYARLSRLAVEVEKHIENWIAVLQPGAKQPGDPLSFEWRWLLLRNVINRRFYWISKACKRPLQLWPAGAAPRGDPGAPKTEAGAGEEATKAAMKQFHADLTAFHIERFQYQCGMGESMTYRVFDGPFCLVSFGCAAYALIAVIYMSGVMSGAADKGSDKTGMEGALAVVELVVGADRDGQALAQDLPGTTAQEGSGRTATKSSPAGRTHAGPDQEGEGEILGWERGVSPSTDPHRHPLPLRGKGGWRDSAVRGVSYAARATG